jgi:AraC-like DNA-binding protein
LTAYRNATKVMSVTYLFLAVANLLESLERLTAETTDNALLFRLVTLIIASTQAFFFTFSMISLFNTGYATWKRFWREVSVISAFIVMGIVSYLVLDISLTTVYSYCFMAFYFSQLIRYTLIFRRLYSRYLLEVENWFSGYEESRLRWINFSFYSALTIGLIAMTCIVIPSSLFGVGSSVVYLLFYVFFAIRFVNYSFVFNILEDVIVEDPEADNNGSAPESFDNKHLAAMKRRIAKWVAAKRYCEPGITLKDLADHLGANTKYLSRYINDYEGKSFRNWIGSLRIEEAQRQMQENPSIKIDIVAEAIGYANKSAFMLQFAKQTNMKPSEWKRNQNLSE